ncbi:MAG: hypothetical protein U5K84_11620 [Alkalibacterium sp.]|nr:hypothetical protein [Alkalibacterium sp.]
METERPPAVSEEVSYAALSIDYESFQKVVGWLSEETLLVHIGDTENHELVSYHIFSGEIEQIYSSETAILTVEINERRDKILFQEIDNDRFDAACNIPRRPDHPDRGTGLYELCHLGLERDKRQHCVRIALQL